MKNTSLWRRALMMTSLTVFLFLPSQYSAAQIPVPSFTYQDQGNGLFLFQDQSQPRPSQWRWTFGDGENANEQHPAHHYQSPGDYEVCLTADKGADTFCRMVRVVLLPQPAFSFQDMGHGLIHFQDHTLHHPTRWDWDFGDGRKSREQHPQHHYLEAGYYPVRLLVSNEAGYRELVQYVNIQLKDIDRLPSGQILRVFPRTVFNWLDLQLDRTTADPIHIQFMNPTGKIMQEVWMQDEFLINMKDWPPGTYYYQIYDHLGHHVGGGKVTVGADATS